MTKLPGTAAPAGAPRPKRNASTPLMPMTPSRAATTATPVAETLSGNRAQYLRLIHIRRPDTGVGEWLAAMVRGLDALDFLERSRDLAAEPVRATPAQIRHRPC